MGHELLDDEATVEAKLKPLLDRLDPLEREIQGIEQSLAGPARWTRMQRGDRQGILDRLKNQRDELRREAAPFQQRLERIHAERRTETTREEQAERWQLDRSDRLDALAEQMRQNRRQTRYAQIGAAIAFASAMAALVKACK
jgi:chromosome segregation ATPase